MKRVASLVDAFQNSSLHLTTVQNIKNEFARPVSASSFSGIKKQQGPSYFRVLMTLLGLVFILYFILTLFQPLFRKFTKWQHLLGSNRNYSAFSGNSVMRLIEVFRVTRILIWHYNTWRQSLIAIYTSRSCTVLGDSHNISSTVN